MSSLGAEEQSKTRADYHRVIDINDPNIAALVDRKLVLVRPDGHVVWWGMCVPMMRALSSTESADTLNLEP